MCKTVDEVWTKPLRTPLSLRKRRSKAISMHTGLCIELLLEFPHYEITRESVHSMDQIEALL